MSDETNSKQTEMIENPAFEFHGAKDILLVYDDKIVIQRKNFFGNTTIYFSDITAFHIAQSLYLQFSFPGLISGYIEQSKIEFGKNKDDEAQKIYEYINRKLKEIKNPTRYIQMLSSSDELRKLKALLDDEIITQEEFNAKKKQLLNL